MDPEERVVVRAVQCLTTLQQLDLLSKFTIVDIVSTVVPLVSRTLLSRMHSLLGPKK